MKGPFTRIFPAAVVGILLASIAALSLTFENQAVLWFVVGSALVSLLFFPATRRVGADLGLGPVPMIALFATAGLLGQAVYQNMQERYQAQLYDAVSSVDIVRDLCVRSAGLLQTDCAGPTLSNLVKAKATDAAAVPKSRAALSDFAIWTLLNDADVLDTRNFPTPNLIADSENIDVPTAMLVAFLKKDERKTETSFGLVRELMRPCGADTFGETDEERKARAAQLLASEQVLALTLADLEDRGIQANHPAFAELGSKGGVDLPEGMTLRLHEFGQQELATLAASKDGFTTFFDVNRMAIPKPYRDEGILTSYLLPRRAFGDGVPVTLLEARQETGGAVETVRGYLSAAGSTVSEVCPGFLNRSNPPESTGGPRFDGEPEVATFDISDEAQFYRALKMREDLALYLTGRIRTADETRSARFWVTLVTGYEQAAMLMLFTLGCFIAVFRIVALSWTYFGGRIWFQQASVPTQKFIFAMRSSRWPLKIIASILPAVGFVGTVRGIMLSLSGADQIVWASTVNERSAAISTLSNDLGLAFATTLIALLLGIIISLINGTEQRLAELVALKADGKSLAGSQSSNGAGVNP